MNLIALKMLVGDRLKYISLVAGLAFAALLVTQQASIFTGYALSTGAWIRDTSIADLWVMDEQVEFSDDIKQMLDTSLTRVRGTDGVAWAVPMFKSYLNAVLPDGTRKNVRLIGLDDATLTGGPLRMVHGSMQDLRSDRAVIMNLRDASDTFMLNRLPEPRPLRVGDRLSINDNEAQVVGTYESTPEFFWEPVLYTTYSRAVFMAPRERRSLMYILVKVRDGVNVADVQRRLGSIPGLTALTNDQFAKQTTSWIISKTGILVNFGMTIALGFIVGVLVSAQTLYTFVLENTRHFAALKAMGATNWTLIRMVALQVLVVGLIGFGIGLGGAVLTGAAFSNIGLQFAMPWPVPVGGLAAILACCLIAGVLSLVRVLRLEPGIVFRS